MVGFALRRAVVEIRSTIVRIVYLRVLRRCSDRRQGQCQSPEQHKPTEDELLHDWLSFPGRNTKARVRIGTLSASLSIRQSSTGLASSSSDGQRRSLLPKSECLRKGSTRQEDCNAAMDGELRLVV